MERTLGRFKRLAVVLLYGRRTSAVGYAEPALSFCAHLVTGAVDLLKRR
jgi:hypothetical protein